VTDGRTDGQTDTLARHSPRYAYASCGKNHDFRPISRLISQMMQDRAIVTMEGEKETAPKISNGTGLNDLE